MKRKTNRLLIEVARKENQESIERWWARQWRGSYNRELVEKIVKVRFP
jgi:hypothetical protein